MYRFVIAALLVASVKGQLVLEGPCNFAATTAVRNLNVSEFLGEWQQIARIPSADDVGDCASSTYEGVVTNGVLVNGTIFNRQVVNRTVQWVNGTFSAGDNGVYIFRYPAGAMNVLVLATDYTGYGLLYSCEQNTTHRTVWSWQISRAKQFTTEQSNLINTAITLNTDLRNATWRAVGHTAEHCKTNSAISILASPIILALVLCNMLSFLS
ncbi:apolipoprotein D-like [Colias croceus]|uniref:apolipoprotein D-like n=1 Tax=Colias crocea TaxID=72248 RepID=UPI001E27D926|nr:apolipoprotein D-like [Colias croceus]